MNIGLVGYYGFGNYGDELFFDVWKNLFSSHNVTIFHDPENNRLLPNFDKLIDQVDLIIIGGGDLLIPWYKSWLYWDEAFLRKPVYVYGIGVPTWDKSNQEVLDWYNKFLNHPNVVSITCRDKDSVDWISRNLNINDKNIAYYPDIVCSCKFERISSVTESKTVGLVLRWQPSYARDNITAFVEYIRNSGYLVKLLMLGIGNTLKDDRRVIEEFEFLNAPVVVRDTIEGLSAELTACDYIVSQKFHGCVVAYLSKIPFIALSTADKFTSFCKDVNAQDYISWDGDPNLIMKFQKVISAEMDYSNLEGMSSQSRLVLKLLKDSIENKISH